MTKRVLLIGNFLSAKRVGSFTVCEALASHLRSAGWTVLAASDKASRLNRLADMLFSVWRWRNEYEVAQVDVYSGLSFVWAEWTCWLLGRLGNPFVLTLHGGNLPAFARRWPGRARRLLNSASVVTTPSRYLQDALRPYCGNLVLLPNALDLRSYQFHLRVKPQPKLVWLRAFHEIYNPSMAPRVLAELAPRFPEIQLTMFGPDKGDGSLERVRAEVRRWKLEDRVLLPGSVAKSEVPRALSQGDIFLNTTNYESFGVSMLEAAACGLCPVSTAVGELPLLWKDGHDALLVKPGDSAAMASAVKRILSEPGLAERLSHNARHKAEQYDWSVILPEWERLLSEVARKGEAPRS